MAAANVVDLIVVLLLDDVVSSRGMTPANSAKTMVLQVQYLGFKVKKAMIF
jgi:hypothetical protein